MSEQIHQPNGSPAVKATWQSPELVQIEVEKTLDKGGLASQEDVQKDTS